MPYRSSDAPAADLEANGHHVSKSTVLFFGTGHESVLFDYVEAAFVALLEIEPSAVFTALERVLSLADS